MERHADVVVIGSGAGGAAVAGQLGLAGAEVVLLEVGGEVAPGPSWHGRNPFPAERDLDRFAAFMDEALSPFAGSERPPADLPGSVVAHALGGLMVTWTHNCPAPDPTLEPVVGVPAEELEEALGRARATLSVSTEVTDGGVRQERLLGRSRQLYPDLARPPQPMPLAARFEADGSIRFTGAGDLLRGGEDAEPGSLTILKRHVARRLGHRDGHVEHVEAADLEFGETVRLTAERFVLAAGAIGTPKLLVASELDAGPALGRYLTDHAHIGSSVLIAEELRADVPADDLLLGVLIPVGDGHPLQSEIVKFPMAVTPIEAEHDPLHRVDVFTTLGAEPRADNRLTFDRDRLDDFGLPHFDAHFGFTPADEEGLRLATAEHVRVLQGIANANAGWDVTTLPAGMSTHLMGTHRIGAADDGESVADPACRLWRSDNLWLAGNGLINHWTACNPSLTTAALGMIAADAILADGR